MEGPVGKENQKDFQKGGLNQEESMIRPNRLFTVSKTAIDYKAGTISKQKQLQVENVIIALITGN